MYLAGVYPTGVQLENGAGYHAPDFCGQIADKTYFSCDRPPADSGAKCCCTHEQGVFKLCDEYMCCADGHTCTRGVGCSSL